MSEVRAEFIAGPLDGKTCRMRMPLSRRWKITINGVLHTYRLARTFPDLVEYEHEKAE